MTGIVEQIQQAALDRDVPVTDLLRRVKLAAAKLSLADAQEWVSSELNGYFQQEVSEVPAYRVASGSLMCRTKYHGVRHAHGDPETIATLSVAFLREPIGSIEALIANTGDRVVLPLDVHLAKMLASHGDTNQYEIHLNKSILHSICDKVRNLALDWAMGLEAEGIVGEGVSFSADEKERAEAAGKAVHVINFGYYQQGDNHGDQNRVNLNSTDQSTNTIQRDVFDQVADTITTQVDDAVAREELLTILGELKGQANTSEYRSLYNRFMSAAADHMTVIAPFLPALAAFIPA